MTTYYIDNAGSDSNSGFSGNAWQTCSKVTSFSSSPGFAAGDAIVFTAGQTFAGPLTIINSGSSGGGYISVGTGRGTTPPTLPSGGVAQSNPAIISIPDSNTEGVAFHDCNYIWLDNISVVGSGVNHSTGVTTSTALGISFKSTQTITRLAHCVITACSVSECRDGIGVWAWPTNTIGFDGFKIWGCSVYYVQISPISFLSYNFIDRSQFVTGITNTTHLNAYVGYCTADHMMGAGTLVAGVSITMNNTQIGLVEHCVSSNINPTNSGFAPAGPGGITSAYSDQVTFDSCESYLCYSTFAGGQYYDGEAFEIDAQCTNFVMRYCYGHDCDGPGFMGTKGTIGYSIFANNKQRAAAITSAGVVPGEITQVVNTVGESGTLIVYGTTIYASGGDCYGVCASGSVGAPAFYNCILVSKAGGKSVGTGATPSALLGNDYFALGGGTITVLTHTSLSALRGAGFETSDGRNYGAFGDPLLLDPAAAPATGAPIGGNFPTITYFDILAASPAVKLGFNYTFSPGTVDFHGNPNGSGGLYDAGAVEISANAGRGRMR